MEITAYWKPIPISSLIKWTVRIVISHLFCRDNAPYTCCVIVCTAINPYIPNNIAHTQNGFLRITNSSLGSSNSMQIHHAYVVNCHQISLPKKIHVFDGWWNYFQDEQQCLKLLNSRPILLLCNVGPQICFHKLTHVAKKVVEIRKRPQTLIEALIFPIFQETTINVKWFLLCYTWRQFCLFNSPQANW